VLPATSPDVATIEAANLVAFDAPSNPVAMLPTGVVVDASAVAVLPFASRGGATLADGLEREVAATLRTVPGLYVIADAAVEPYAATDLSASQVGELLGARGLVDASVELIEGRVLVDAQLRETATGETLWQAQFDRPVDELRAVRDEMADGIAGVMLDPGLRAPPAIGAGSDDGVSASKPFQQ
jgi:TolB-like protein